MAVYTHVAAGDAKALLANYNIGDLVSLEPIATGVENSNYRLCTSVGKYILTLFEKRTKAEDLPFFFAAMESMASAGIPAPRPAPDRHGRIQQTVCGKPAAIVTFLDGAAITRTPTPDECQRLGAILGAMHNAAAKFPLTRQNPLSIQGWRLLADACGERAREVRSGYSEIIAAELAFLNQAWPDELPAGLVHTDLFPDNVLFKEGEISGVIDFYFSCTDFFAYDIAVCLNAWCRTDSRIIDPISTRALIDGYLRERPLSDAELSALPILARGAALRFLLTRLYDWLHQTPGAMVKVKNPSEYAEILLFHQTSRITDFIS